jgi:hypothetical protein
MSKVSGSDYMPIQRSMKEHQVVVDGLTNGERYYFVVTSVNNSWPSVESNYSTEVSTVPSPQIPGAPVMGGGSAEQAATPANGEILVKGWGLPTSELKGYNLYISESPDSGYRKVNDTPITAASYLAQGLDIGRHYWFMLTSVSNDNPPVESRPSPPWSLISHAAGATQ